MNKDKIIEFENPATAVVNDSLTDFIRSKAQSMIRAAVEQEVEEFMNSHVSQQLDNGHQRLVRNGSLPERSIQTGVGEIDVSVPRVRDRAKTDKKINFESQLIPKYMRRTATLDVMLPLLYLKGISVNQFKEVLAPILGKDAKALSPGVISRLKDEWVSEYAQWSKRDLSDKRYAYMWADGVYLSARMENEKVCMLVIVGADEHGRKELVTFMDGYRESKESWLELLNDLKSRGLKHIPELGIGDGALGFWAALNEAFPKTEQQRCWVHKTRNILDKLPKSQQAKAKDMIHDIYQAESQKDADVAFDAFIKHYRRKYAKAAECLEKDRDSLLTFYQFPAEHWIHLRTTNPIESTFSTVKQRTRQSKGCFSRKTILGSVYKLMMEAQKRWRPLNGSKRIAEVLQMVKFIDGIPEYELSNIKKEKAA